MTQPAALQPTSPIKRSMKSTFTSLIVAVVCAIISVALFMTIVEGPITVGIALIPAILALVFGYGAIAGAGECACPACGKTIDGLSTGANDGELCSHCHGYFEGKNGQLWSTDPARIADSPQFTAPIPETFSFPDVCCVCGNPATKKVPIKLSMGNASSAVTAPTVGVTTTTIVTVEVPHCDQHKDGALLTGTPKKTHIRFRSYPYLRAFCERNNVTPG